MRQKVCKVCKEKFLPSRPLQSCCCPSCAIAWATSVREKKERKEVKERLAKLKTRSEWLQDLQTEVNKLRRIQEEGSSCISCDTPYHQIKKKNAGHYLSRGSHPELRFEPLNIWLQCEHCNTHKSGNQIEYRKRLIKKIGIEKVEWLEGPHPPLKMSIVDIQCRIRGVREEIRSLEKSRRAGTIHNIDTYTQPSSPDVRTCRLEPVLSFP